MDGRAQEVVEKSHVAPPPAASAKMPNEITMCRVCFLHRQSACIDPALVRILLGFLRGGLALFQPGSPCPRGPPPGPGGGTVSRAVFDQVLQLALIKFYRRAVKLDQKHSPYKQMV